MATLHERWMKQIRLGLQKRTASMIRVGLGYAELLTTTPPEQHADAVAACGELLLQEGYEPLSLSEATLLARLARQHPQLQHTSKVNLESPAVQAVYRQLADIFSCIDRRAYTRVLAKTEEVG